MEIKRGRGRQPIPKSDKKVPITVWVKTKHLTPAKKDCKKVEEKYDLLP